MTRRGIARCPRCYLPRFQPALACPGCADREPQPITRQPEWLRRMREQGLPPKDMTRAG